MEKLKRLDKTRLHHSEHLEFTKFMLDWAKAANIEKFKTLIASLEVAYNAEYKAMHASKPIRTTKELKAFREVRNQRVTRLITTLKAKKLDKNTDIATKAGALLTIVRSYPALKGANIPKSTGDVFRLMGELQDGQQASIVTAVGVSDDVHDVDEANKALEKEYKKQLEKGGVNVAEVRIARKQSDALLSTLATLAQAMNVVDSQTASLDTFIAANNEMVDKMRAIMSKRNATNKQKSNRKKENDIKMITPHLDALSEQQGLAKGSYVFTGSATGLGANRVYKLQEHGTIRFALAKFNKHGVLEIKKKFEGRVTTTKKSTTTTDITDTTHVAKEHGVLEPSSSNPSTGA